jgi:hypothetical protein
MTVAKVAKALVRAADTAKRVGLNAAMRTTGAFRDDGGRSEFLGGRGK